MNDLVVVRRPKSRFVELALLIFAMALAFGGYALTHLNIHGNMPSNWPWVLGVWVGLTLILWGLIFKFIPYSDPVMLPCVILLNGLGLAMIHRIDQIPDPVRHYAERQLVWTMAGMACFAAVIIFLRKYRILHAIPNTLAVIGLALLLLPMVPGLGASRFGANIWVQIGGMSFQPAEIAKLVLTVAFASYLVDKEVVLAVSTKRFLWVDWPRARDLGPILVMWLASLVVLVHQTDLGTSRSSASSWSCSTSPPDAARGRSSVGYCLLAAPVWPICSSGTSEFGWAVGWIRLPIGTATAS